MNTNFNVDDELLARWKELERAENERVNKMFSRMLDRVSLSCDSPHKVDSTRISQCEEGTSHD